MKTLRFISILALVPALLTACGEESGDSSKCTTDTECGSNKVCNAGKCEAKPSTDKKANGDACSRAGECSSSYCGPDGKCADIPTGKKANGETCSTADECASNYCSSDGKCADAPVSKKANGDACSSADECSSNYCGADGKCADKQEPVSSIPCNNNLGCPAALPICSAKECKAISAVSCGSNDDCGLGYKCADKVCTAITTCDHSKQIGCDDHGICHNGVCMDNTVNTCSKTVACPSGLTCIAGECVTCSCQSDETCTLDGKCVKASHSDVKNINAGDPCVYKDNKESICDNNRLISCSSATGENGYSFKITDCGANICAKGLNGSYACQEPCSQESDSYGECYSDYNSMTATSQDTAFLNLCSKSPEGKLFWSYEDKTPFCNWTCTNGYCDSYPEEYGTSCNDHSKDRCEGDWSIYCLAGDAGQSGVIYADHCAKMYEKDAYCTMNPDNKPECVSPCDKAGDTKMRCIGNSSVSYLQYLECKLGTDGKLAYYEAKFDTCATKCDADAGTCE